MQDMKPIIDKALRERPDYGRLDRLSTDVWQKVRTERRRISGGFHLPFSFKVSTVVLSLLALFAFSQVSFQAGRQQADFFDLRFFSHESAPSLNFASVNTYEFTP